MTYKEAKLGAFGVRWKVGICPSGDECWCRPIQGEEPILFNDGYGEDEYFIVDVGYISKEIAHYIVELHNKNLTSKIIGNMVEQNQKLGLYDPPYISDDFQIGPDGAYEHTEDFPTKPGFVERRMALGKAQNNKDWDAIYESYIDIGVFNLHEFMDWLKQNYIAPEKI